MLYNTKWEKPADVFSLESLVAWLERRPPNEVYCYADTGHCLLAQYFHASGRPAASLGNCIVSFHGESSFSMLPGAFQRVATNEPHTFGAALDRARGALTAQGSPHER